MTGPNVVMAVEIACKAVDYRDDGDEPCGKGAEIEARCVPVGTAWVAVVEGGNVDVAFADNEVVGAVNLGLDTGFC